MADVIEMAKRRKPQTYEQQHKGDDRYYCLKCDRDYFKLWASGAVTCFHCGSLMGNLYVSFDKPSA